MDKILRAPNLGRNLLVWPGINLNNSSQPLLMRFCNEKTSRFDNANLCIADINDDNDWVAVEIH